MYQSLTYSYNVLNVPGANLIYFLPAQQYLYSKLRDNQIQWRVARVLHDGYLD